MDIGEKRRANDRALRIVSPLVALAAWQLLVTAGVLRFDFLPAPDAVLAEFAREVASGELPGHAARTGGMALLAAAIAMVVGGVTGLGIGLSRRLRTNVMASIDVLRTIPAIALMPVVMLAVGPRPGAQLLLAAWAAQWPILINTAGGAADIHPRLHDVGQMLQFTRAANLRKIVLPAVVPAWLVGARVATIISLHVTITAEMVMAPVGLGGAIVRSLDGLAVERLWAYALTCGLLGGLFNAGLRRLLRWVLPGSPANRPAGRP